MGNGEQVYDQVGAVCRAHRPSPSISHSPEESRYTMQLPLRTEQQRTEQQRTEQDALAFLSGLGGDAAGAGRGMLRIGIDAPALRARYKLEIEGLARQIAERMQRGESTEEVARWASDQRRQIVRRMRAGSGPVAQAAYEIRDWRKYGRGGRTYPNMVRPLLGQRASPGSRLRTHFGAISSRPSMLNSSGPDGSVSQIAELRPPARNQLKCRGIPHPPALLAHA